MEGGRVGEGDCSTYTETFHKAFPYYLSLGMPYDLFWFGDPQLAVDYRKSGELRERQKDREAWNQGLYVYEALCEVSPILRPLSKPKRPKDYAHETHIERVEKKQVKDGRDALARQEIVAAQLAARIDKWTKNHEKAVTNNG